MSTLYDIPLLDIDGQETSLAAYRGQKLMIVNLASECGFTPQYEALQTLYTHFKPAFTVLGFPCNDFGGQEPGNETAVKQFCHSRYGVTFPLFSKIHIKGQTHPLYEWLTQRKKNGTADADVEWNFHKFLINEKGEWIASLPSATLPHDEKVLNWITNDEWK